MSKKTININLFCPCHCPLQKKKETDDFNPDFADINGIKLCRKNETLKLSTVEHFAHDEAMRLFDHVGRKRLPEKSEWERMLKTGYTWDSERQGIWIGRRHAERRETRKSTFLPAAGYRNTNSSALVNAGTGGYYWSSSTTGNNAYNLTFNSSSVRPALNYGRAYGFSVRCVAE